MSAFVAWPVDAHGRLLPLVPVRLTFFVSQSPRGWPSDVYRVSHASSRMFRVRGPESGQEREYPADAWGSFLDALGPGENVRLHLPGCNRARCAGCDGSAIGRGASPEAFVRPSADPTRAGVTMSSMSPPQRDRRILRAANDVLQRYTFEQTGDGTIEVRGGRRNYAVRVCPEWSVPPSCDCPDAERIEVSGYCKHVVAVLLRDPALTPQLLEVFL